MWEAVDGEDVGDCMWVVSYRAENRRSRMMGAEAHPSQRKSPDLSVPMPEASSVSSYT